MYSNGSGRVRRVVQAITSLILTLQIAALAASVIFYFYSIKPDTRQGGKRESRES